MQAYFSFFQSRDVTVGNFLVQPLQRWAGSAHPGQNRVKVSENLGAVPAVTNLLLTNYNPVLKRENWLFKIPHNQFMKERKSGI